jgi:hypothetical protein
VPQLSHFLLSDGTFVLAGRVTRDRCYDFYIFSLKNLAKIFEFFAQTTVSFCKNSSGVDAMITIFCDFLRFLPIFVFSKKTNVMIKFLHNVALL